MADQTYIYPSPLRVEITGATNFAVSGNLTVAGTSILTGALTINGGMVVPATKTINMVTGSKILANGNQAGAITDAETAHDLDSVFSDTQAETALDALGTKVNSILAALRGAGVIAT